MVRRLYGRLQMALFSCRLDGGPFCKRCLLALRAVCTAIYHGPQDRAPTSFICIIEHENYSKTCVKFTDRDASITSEPHQCPSCTPPQTMLGLRWRRQQDPWNTFACIVCIEWTQALKILHLESVYQDVHPMVLRSDLQRVAPAYGRAEAGYIDVLLCKASPAGSIHV